MTDVAFPKDSIIRKKELGKHQGLGEDVAPRLEAQTSVSARIPPLRQLPEPAAFMSAQQQRWCLGVWRLIGTVAVIVPVAAAGTRSPVR